MNRDAVRPPVLSIAGSDSSAGAGIQADLKAIAANGAYGLTAVTCVVAEVPGKVTALEGVSSDLLRRQLEVLLTSFPVAAAKTGLLFNADHVRLVADALRERDFPIVVDPVMVATGGDRLLAEDAVGAYEAELLPLATVITPNLDEAAVWLGATPIDESSMVEAAKVMAAQFGTSVLLKGGHLEGDAVDVLASEGTLEIYRAPRTPNVATHGSGCTFSAAIAAQLGRGASLVDAIRVAKGYVSEVIAQCQRWRGLSGGELHALEHFPIQSSNPTNA